MNRLFRIFTLFIIFSLLIVPLFSQEVSNTYHIIREYNIEVIGKSNPKKIKSFIEPSGGEPVFSSSVELEKALQAKRQLLNNMRLFESVTYSYEPISYQENAIYYRADFVIKDAFSFIAIPYPKYDSNYGFRLGLKAYDKNLFGSFSDLYFYINTTQIDNSWRDFKWESEIAVTNIPIGPSSLDVTFQADTIQHGKNLEDFLWATDINWKNIKLDRSTLALNFNFKDEGSTTTDFDRWMEASIQWSSLPFINLNLTVKPQIRLRRVYEDKPWDIYDASFYTSISPIKINGEQYNLTNTMYVKFPHSYIRSTSKLSLINAKIFSLPFGFWFSADNYFDMKSQYFYNNTYSIGSSIDVNLPFKSVYRSSFEVSIGERLTAETLNFVPIFSTTQRISFGSVNWSGNLRKGLKGTVSATFDYGLFDASEFNKDYLKYVAYADILGFAKIKDKAQLSSRIQGFYSNVPPLFEGHKFPTFMPNGSRSAISLIRGILNSTFESAVGTNSYQKLGAVINLDATLMLFKLGSFADAFINGFFDLGVFSTTVNPQNDINKDDLIIFKTIGFEGYGIIRKFPSYPIRASLGFNLDDIIKHVKGQIGFTDIEFVLTIGMGLHY